MRWIVYLFLLMAPFAFADDLQFLTRVRPNPNETAFESVTHDFEEDYHSSSRQYDDADDKDVSIGFSFPFNGTYYSTVSINSNGLLYFSSNNYTAYSNNHLPISNSAAAQSILPYWDDLNLDGDSSGPPLEGSIRYGTLGSGANQRFVVSWEGVPHYTNSGSYSFQVVLYKDGAIRFRYDSSSDADGSSNGGATIGVQESTSNYDEFSYNSTIDQTKDVLYLPTSISGHVYEDPNGDSQMGDRIAKSGVTVNLYQDGATGSVYRTTTTDANGYYKFSNLPVNQVYWVAVDSKTVTPDQTFGNGNDQGDVWAEQTYGGIGAQCADGSGGTTELNSAGSCFGGRDGAVSDDASAYSSSEHLIRVDTNEVSDNPDKDFGFSFNVVTSVRDGDDDAGADRSVQGSLRQFVQNANALDGANTMRFVPAVSTNAGTWWEITLNSDLDNITDDQTIINGTAYRLTNGVTVDNRNSGSVAIPASTVGAGDDGRESTGDEHALPEYEKKELEINGGDHRVFDIRGDDSTIENLSIYNSSSPAVYVRNDRVTLENIYLGARADGTQPSGDDQVSRGIIATSDADDVTIDRNYIAYTARTAVMVSGTGEITENVFHQNALAAFNPDAITVEGNTNKHAVSVRYNYIDSAGGYGIESWNSGGGFDIQYNTILNTGSVGSDELGGIRIFGVDSTVAHNLIKNTHGAGIAVVSKGAQTDRNIISRNVIYGNSGLSIDLDNSGESNPDGDGVTPNNGTLDPNNQNNDMDYPVVTAATYDGSTLHIEGYVGSAAGQSTFGNAALEVYIADDDGNNNGEIIAGDGQSVAHGEGKAFLFDCTADGNGNINCNYSGTVDTSAHLTLTATLSSEGTSEFSANYPIILLPVMHVTKTSCVISDPVNVDTNPKRIPGATIRYAIEVRNTGIGDAQNSIVDDNVSSHFDTASITIPKVLSGACPDCADIAGGSDSGTVSGNTVKLDFGTVSANSSECGYFEVDIK